MVSHPFLTQLQTSKAQVLQKRMGHAISFFRETSERQKGEPPANQHYSERQKKRLKAWAARPASATPESHPFRPILPRCLSGVICVFPVPP